MNLNRDNKKMMYGIFVWHGFFLALTMSMIDFNTVLPSLINNLMESKIIFGSLYSILLGAPKLFNIIFSHYLESYQYKKKFLMLGIYLRAFSFLGMAVTTYFFAPRSPVLVIVSFYVWVSLFALSGGFAGLSYSEIIAKLVARPDRGRLFAFKEFASSVAAFTGGLIVSRIFRMESLPFPSNYALNFVIGFSGLIIAAFAFWMIDEPPSQVESEDRIPLGEFFAKVINILKKDRRFSNFIVVENLSSFSLMVLPFYMLYARDIFGVGEAYIGKYLLFQIAGKVSSNLIWGYIADRLSSRMVVKLCIIGGALTPILALLITPMGPDIYAGIFFLVGFLRSGRRVGFEPYLLNIIPAARRTTYLGIRGSFNFLLVILPLIGGSLINLLGYRVTFLGVSTVMVIAFFLLAGSTGTD